MFACVFTYTNFDLYFVFLLISFMRLAFDTYSNVNMYAALCSLSLYMFGLQTMISITMLIYHIKQATSSILPICNKLLSPHNIQAYIDHKKSNPTHTIMLLDCYLKYCQLKSNIDIFIDNLSVIKQSWINRYTPLYDRYCLTYIDRINNTIGYYIMNLITVHQSTIDKYSKLMCCDQIQNVITVINEHGQNSMKELTLDTDNNGYFIYKDPVQSTNQETPTIPTVPAVLSIPLIPSIQGIQPIPSIPSSEVNFEQMIADFKKIDDEIKKNLNNSNISSNQNFLNTFLLNMANTNLELGEDEFIRMCMEKHN